MGEREYHSAWVRAVGTALLKGERKEVRVFEDGRAQMLIEFPSFDDLLLVMKELDALKMLAPERVRDTVH